MTDLTPTPATDEREAVARAIKGMLFRIWGSLYDDAATRLADAALSALAPVRAAEILAAEANERARIAILLEALVDISKAAMIAKAMCDDADREPWQMIADRARKAIDAHLGRNEHGAGK